VSLRIRLTGFMLPFKAHLPMVSFTTKIFSPGIVASLEIRLTTVMLSFAAFLLGVSFIIWSPTARGHVVSEGPHDRGTVAARGPLERELHWLLHVYGAHRTN
jgi:TRAP-type C4-dicarboxylate transport system permease small subunit